MRIFVAGGTGAVGRPLVSQLVAAGHEVTVFARTEGRVAALGLPDVTAAVGDALKSASLTSAVQAARSSRATRASCNCTNGTAPRARAG